LDEVYRFLFFPRFAMGAIIAQGIPHIGDGKQTRRF
jgi:hypothetical protein